MRKIFLNNFHIKLIAIITMTIDHIGLLLPMIMPENETLVLVSTIFRYIGRISLPLFCFLIVQGSLNTKNIKNYILRLGIIALPISLFQTIGEIAYYSSQKNLDYRFRYPNIFILLILGVFMIYCLEHKNKYMKLLSLIPITISTVAFICTALEFENNYMIWWFPYMLRPQYDVLGLGMILFFYLAYKVTPLLYESIGLNQSLYNEIDNYKFTVNLVSVLGLVIVSMLYYSFYFIKPSWVYWEPDIQLFAMVSGLIILFYNYKKGYSSRWFKIFSYVYYPLHLMIIFAIINIVMMII